MKFQEMLSFVEDSAANGKNVLVHSANWDDIMWCAFKCDEKGSPICTIFIKKENGKYSYVNGARFTSFEIKDIMSDWLVETI